LDPRLREIPLFALGDAVHHDSDKQIPAVAVHERFLSFGDAVDARRFARYVISR
jgi:hypothetical protein